MSKKDLRIGFMGTPDFAYVALKAIIEAGYNVVCAYSQPPRPKGRGHKLQKSPVHEYAEAHGIPVFTPKSLKSEEAKAEFASHNLDAAIVAAYGLILPQEILDAPKFGCLNIHGSLLPKWRGAAPIQYSIWKGDDETGITIMQMEKGLDTGPMISKRSVAILNETTALSLHDALAELGADMALEILEQLSNGEMLTSEKQNDALSSYASMLKKEDGIIGWNKDAHEIDRQIRALNPWPGVWTSTDGKRLKILAAEVIEESAAEEVGTLLNKNGDVSCGKNILRLITIQPEGKKAMDVASAFNGNYLNVNSVLN